ncbi:MAG: DUF835 domain-containing protein [Thermoplasmata archaeon]
MDKEKMIELYLKGYEEGLKEGWRGAKSMVSRYDGWELKSRMEGKLGTLYQDVRSKRYKLLDDPCILEPEEVERTPAPETLDIPEITEGNMYLFIETRPESSLNTFFEYVSDTCKGLCITDESIESIVNRYGENDNVVYCTLGKSYGSSDHESVNYGNLNKLGTVVGKFFKFNEDAVILFDGIDRVIHYVDFAQLQKFMDFVREKANDNKGIVLVSLPSGIMEKKQFNQFRNTFHEEFKQGK